MPQEVALLWNRGTAAKIDGTNSEASRTREAIRRIRDSRTWRVIAVEDGIHPFAEALLFI